MSDWRKVSKASPCPVCEKPDWCAWTSDAWLKCERGTDPPQGMVLVKLIDNGGLFRPADDRSPGHRVMRTSSENTMPDKKPQRDWAALARRFAEALHNNQLGEWAKKLNVHPQALRALEAGRADSAALRALRVGWSGDRNLARPSCAMTFPEHDGAGNIIGISVRAPDGRKGTPFGAKRGLIVPKGFDSMPDPVLPVEGPSDVAACLTMGLTAVGRPSNCGGISHLAELVRGHKVLVAGENDRKVENRTERWPGRDGAKKVAQALAKGWGKPVQWALPPDGAKDIRAWLKSRKLDLTDRSACEAAGRELLDALLAKAVEVPRPTGGSISQTLDGVPYRHGEHGILWIKPTKDGTLDVPLSNFDARIIGHIVEDDGAEQRSAFEIEATLHGRTSRFSIPADRFAGLTWVTERLGPSAIFYPGFTVKDHLRVAIQMRSGEPPRRDVYTHLGWREVGGTWIYLHAGGAIGPNGTVSGVEVSLPHELAGFELPPPPIDDELVEAVRAHLRLLELAPTRIMVPSMASVWSAALGGCDYSVHASGPTGSFKTQLAALLQQHYGAHLDATHLPASWLSTGNALEGLAFVAKDAVLVIDDLAPGGTVGEVQRIHREAARVFRAQGNQSARQRMRPDGTLRPAKPPRAMIFSTGEDIPHGHSVRARLLVIEIGKDDIDPKKLSACQADAAAGLYAKAMSGFLTWLGRSYEAVDRRRYDEIVKLRDQAMRSGDHRRTTTTIASLGIGWRYFLRFATDAGAIDIPAAENLWERGWTALRQAAEAQAAHHSAADPVPRFRQLLASAIASGRAHVAEIEGDAPHKPKVWGWRLHTIGTGNNEREDWQPQGDRIGWVQGADLYLDRTASYKAAQQMITAGEEPIGVGPDTLWKRIQEQGVIVTADKARHTVRKQIEGKRHRVLHVRASYLGAEPGQLDQSGHNSLRGAESGEAPTVLRTDSSASATELARRNGPQEGQEHAFGPAGPVGPRLLQETMVESVADGSGEREEFEL